MKEYLAAIQSGKTLSQAEASALMTTMLDPQTPPEQIAAALFGLSVRGETSDEVTGFITALRQRMLPMPVTQAVLDTCGTGGDGRKTFNISTATALVCAAMGIPVVKHGNVAISSQSGSADCLAALHIPTQLTGVEAQQYLAAHNFVFAFAPLYHPALKTLGPMRRALGVRTIMNFLGPVLNPAQPAWQLIGVADVTKATMLGEVLMRQGAQHVVLVHSDDGLDEVSIAASTSVFDYTPNGLTQFTIEPPQSAGGQPFQLEEIVVESAPASATVIKQLATHQAAAAARTAIELNAGLALYAGNRVPNFSAGVAAVSDFLQTNRFADYLNTL